MSVDQGLSAVGGGSADASPGLRGRPATAIKACDHETLDRIITGLVTVVPILLLGLAAWQAWSEALRWSDLVVLGLLYVLTALGITVGFHRLLTHRSFATKPWLRGVFAALGSAAIEGPAISWVRKHHACSDREGDPHSPHVGHGDGLFGSLRGLYHAHVGWLFIHTQRGSQERFAPDLLADPVVPYVGENQGGGRRQRGWHRAAPRPAAGCRESAPRRARGRGRGTRACPAPSRR